MGKVGDEAGQAVRGEEGQVSLDLLGKGWATAWTTDQTGARVTILCAPEEITRVNGWKRLISVTK